jgi:hypothetical protein
MTALGPCRPLAPGADAGAFWLPVAPAPVQGAGVASGDAGNDETMYIGIGALILIIILLILLF